MRAIILAAGFGTRLAPHTQRLPKPLFPVCGTPLIDRLIHRMAAAGVTSVLVNAHHLADALCAHIQSTRYPVPVFHRKEETLLDTGGAIANMKDMGDGPTLIVNADIDTDLDFSTLIRFHETRNAPATLVVTPHPTLAAAGVSKDGKIMGFREDPLPEDCRKLAFCGIQILSEAALSYFEKGAVFSSITAYQKMIAEENHPVAFFLPETTRWSDVGTPERFREAVLSELLCEAATNAWGEKPAACHRTLPLCGDGSDRGWQRILWPDQTMIVADHGIHTDATPSEAAAFVAIGRHLAEKKLPVPRIYGWDLFSGLVCMEDLGEERLHDRILKNGVQAALPIYREILDLLPRFHHAAKGFTPEMAHTTPRYDRHLILERECGYFLSAFVSGVLGLTDRQTECSEAFRALADRMENAHLWGFLHRDLQSRNIMVKKNRPFLIDFQGGMIGPVAYDLAALLLDPYAALPQEIQDDLLETAARHLAASLPGIRKEEITEDFRHAAVCRNLQMLGAFGFLWKQKGKPFFRQFIPPAARTLVQTTGALQEEVFAPLKKLAQTIATLTEENPDPYTL